MTEKVCLIDGSGYIFRAFFASPPMTNPEGLPVNAVYGFLNMFLSLTAHIKCDYCLVLFDAKRQNFRNEFFPEYKATRPELPPELKPQFELIHQAVEALNIPWLMMEGYEADDLIATFADIALKEGKEVTIVSADKDLMQLIRPGVEFYDSMKNKYFTPEDVKEKFGVYPERVTDVQALAGDSTDNIPGVPGIGIKTAAELINQFGSLEQVLARAEEIKQNKRRELIMEHKEDALVSQKLVTLKADVPVELKLSDIRCLAPLETALNELLDRHAFKSLKNKAQKWLKDKCGDLKDDKTVGLLAAEIVPNYQLIGDEAALKELKEKIKAENMFSFMAHTAGDVFLGVSLGLSGGNAFYLPLGSETAIGDLFSAPQTEDGLLKKVLADFLSELFQDKSILKISLNLKDNLHLLSYRLGVEEFPEPYDDVAVISYDLYSSAVNHTVSNLAEEFLEKGLKSAALEHKKTDFKAMPAAEALSFFAEEADFVMRLFQKLRPELIKEKRLFVYDAMDRPLLKVLYMMERRGVMLDKGALMALDERFDAEMKQLEAEIYEMAGETFNLSSPKQVGEILYGKLGLKGKKHATGTLNTSAEVLEQMAETHELPRKILDWRQVQKLKSTYTGALLTLMDKESRVHTTYSQVSVNTGRLSSLNPNLQNIPIRMPAGREIRRTFIAKPGHKLIAADYSQVELRLLATIADAPFLQESFKANVDIHRKTASQVFGIPYEDVDATHRRRAKAINFGIVYGISAYGLAKEIESTPTEAQRYIDAYFANMPEVKRYMEETIAFGRQYGYVLTPFNRKIAIYGIQSGDKRLAAFAERAAINAPIQGGAADIIKLAMKRIEHKLKEDGLKTEMLLQVHDELVFEAPIEEIERVSKLIKEEMENVTGIELKAPLVAEVGIGDNWDEAH